MEIMDRVFAPDDCAIAEGVVGGSGIRRLLRFETGLMNRGMATWWSATAAIPTTPTHRTSYS
jgi:hypothetical protein